MSAAAEDFYEAFSRDVGLRDWTLPNPRHEQLRLVLARVLDGRRALRILDVGCGAGVMSRHLTRYGDVEGIDISASAVVLARTLVPAARFHAGRLEDVGLPGPYDLITLFDVLEHVPRPERRAFLAGVRDRLAEGGLLFASTPHGEFTRWLLAERPELAQAVEVEVDLAAVLADARALGLELVHYEVYEIEFARQYQAMAFVRAPAAAGGAPRMPPSLRRRLKLAANPLARAIRRTIPAARVARAHGLPAAARVLRADVPSGRPDEHRLP